MFDFQIGLPFEERPPQRIRTFVAQDFLSGPDSQLSELIPPASTGTTRGGDRGIAPLLLSPEATCLSLVQAWSSTGFIRTTLETKSEVDKFLAGAFFRGMAHSWIVVSRLDETVGLPSGNTVPPFPKYMVDLDGNVPPIYVDGSTADFALNLTARLANTIGFWASWAYSPREALRYLLIPLANNQDECSSQALAPMRHDFGTPLEMVVRAMPLGAVGRLLAYMHSTSDSGFAYENKGSGMVATVLSREFNFVCDLYDELTDGKGAPSAHTSIADVTAACERRPGPNQKFKSYRTKSLREKDVSLWTAAGRLDQLAEFRPWRDPPRQLLKAMARTATIPIDLYSEIHARTARILLRTETSDHFRQQAMKMLRWPFSFEKCVTIASCALARGLFTAPLEHATWKELLSRQGQPLDTTYVDGNFHPFELELARLLA